MKFVVFSHRVENKKVVSSFSLKNNHDWAIFLPAIQILKNIGGIEFVMFDDEDVVRHKLVKDIIKAYGSNNENQSDWGFI